MARIIRFSTQSGNRKQFFLRPLATRTNRFSFLFWTNHGARATGQRNT